MDNSRPRIGIVLTGGGARAAYQVGVLRAIAELVPRESGNPFPIISGTSAGAINAVALAADAGHFRRSVLRLQAVWKNFHAEQVYRTDPLGVLANSARWIASALTGGGGSGRDPIALLDSSPLRTLLRERVEFGAIQRCIDAGYLHALAITCSGYTSGQSVCFFQGAAGAQPWKRARRIGAAMPIQLEHLLASSALPFIFPPVRINREFFGDGSMRQLAPLSPALHFGADRVLVIAVGRQMNASQAPERLQAIQHPTLAQIAGHALNSIFLDSMEVDLERLQRINKTLALIPPAVLSRSGSPLRHVDCMVVAPSEEIERIAIRHVESLPRTLRLLFRTVGATQRGGAVLLSYLLFEKSFCRELIGLGYRDAMARRDNLRGFLGLSSEWYCELRAPAA